MQFACRELLVVSERSFPYLWVRSVQCHLVLKSRSGQGYYVEGLRLGFRRMVIQHPQNSVILVTIIDWLMEAPREVARS